MELLKEFWAIVGAAVASIVWLVRLEAGMMRNQEDIKRVEKERHSDQARADAHRDKIDSKLDQIIQKLGEKADR